MKALVRAVAVGASFCLAGGVASAQIQTKEQQKCINKINKDMIKLAAQQGKENTECVEDFVKGSLVTTAEVCLTSDPNGKIASRSQKTIDDETKNGCGMGGPNPPTIGYTSAATVNGEGVANEIGLIHDVFGNPIDGSLMPCNPNEEICQCQRFAVDRIEKIYRAAGKIWTKCKKAALEVGKDPWPLGAASATELSICIDPAMASQVNAAGLSVTEDTKGKISNATTQLTDALNQFCSGVAGLPASAFTMGKCSAAAMTGTAALADCLHDAALCRFCVMVQDGDNIPMDCDTWSGSNCEAVP